MAISRKLLTGAVVVWTATITGVRPEAAEPVPESRLLDVHITVFAAAEDFIPEVRDAEARYVPVVLKHVLERADNWGSVRVVPEAGHADLTIAGAVVRSYGGGLELEIRATDATGDGWLDKKYRGRPNVSEYTDPESTVDPFLHVYHRFADELAKKYRKLDPEEIDAIRQASRLRFAAELAPDAFADYVVVDKGRYGVVHLPARDDPMMARVDRIRQRDAVFVDTVDAYYVRLFHRMAEPYHGWRSQDYWQREAMKNGPPTAARSGGANAPLGVLRVGDDRRWPGNAMLCYTPDGRPSRCEEELERVRERQRERRIEEKWRKSHLDVLRELGESLATNVAPLVVEVEGNVSELTGSVDEQYAKWRALMKEIFAAETGGVH